MTDALLRGEFLRTSRGLTVADSTGITWTFDKPTNTLSLAVTAAAIGSFDESVDDRVAALIQNGTGISWSYNDGSNTLTPTVSLASFSTTDLAEGSNLYFTDERAQDAVGAILTDTASIDFTYNDGANTITADVKTGWAPTWTALHTFQAGVVSDHLYLGGQETMVVAGTTIDAQLQVNSDTAAIVEVHTHSSAAATQGGLLYFARGRGSEATPAIVQSGDYLGLIAAVGWDGTDYAQGARIDFIVSAAPGAGDMPTDIVFSTSSDGGESPIERFRISQAALTATVPFYAPAGSAAAPSFTFSGDPDTGFYDLSANIIGIAAAGAYIGKLGTGAYYFGVTTSPGAGLPTSGVIAETDMAIIRTNAPNFTFVAVGSTGSITTPGLVQSGNQIMSIRADGFTDTATLTQSVELRAVAGSTWSATNAEAFLSFYTTASGAVAQTEALRLTSAQRALFVDGAVGTPAVSFLSDPDNGLYRIGTNNWGLAAGGVLNMDFTTTAAKFDLGLVRNNVISPAQIVANTDNYNPTGLSTCNVLRINTDAARNLTGITALTPGTDIILCNTGAFTITLVHDATSTAANRFYCPGSANYSLTANMSVHIMYDGTSSRWRVVN